MIGHEIIVLNKLIYILSLSRIGDVIIAVNERLVDGRPHEEAVQALKAAGLQARMVSEKSIEFVLDS